MSEGSHLWGCCKGVGDLSYASIPATNVGDISWCGEGEDIINEGISGFNGFRGDGKTKKVDGLFCELEFIRVKNASMFLAGGKELTNSLEVGSNICIVQETVVNTLLEPGGVSNDVVHAVGVGVAS